MKHLPLSPELRAKLRELLEIDPTSPSGLRWKVSRGRAAADSPAGRLDSKGHWEVKLNRQGYLAHRLAWALTHDEDPGDRQVDHIDGKRANNDPANLRLATHGENRHNSKQQRNNTSGHKGVSRFPGRNAWRVQLMLDRKQISKTFPDSKHGGTEAALAAAAAWIRSKREELHGEFARHG